MDIAWGTHMFRWYRQLSVIARLRGLALLAVMAMLALAASLLWTSYQQRLADRHAAAGRHIELAHASVQWAYARQQFGKLNATQARQQTIDALARLRSGRPPLTETHDVHSALLGQAAVTLGAVLLVSALLWAGIEITARELDGSGRNTPPSSSTAPTKLPANSPAMSHASLPARPAARGPQAYRQGPAPAAPALSLPRTETAEAPSGASDAPDGSTDPNEAYAQEVRRLRMAGAI